MGCPLGSFGFDLALQGSLLRCAAKTPVVVRSLADDCNLALLLPTDHNEAVLQLRAALAQLETDAKDNLNLDLNMSNLSAPCCCRPITR